jgi:hypothetical protein
MLMPNASENPMGSKVDCVWIVLRKLAQACEKVLSQLGLRRSVFAVFLGVMIFKTQKS